MAEQTHVSKRIEKVRGKDLQGKVHVLDKTQPQQLVLFQTFLPEDDPDEKFSNTIEFYDAIPKYFSNPRLIPTVSPLLTPITSRNILLLPSLPHSIPYRQDNVRRRKDDPGVGTAARRIVA
jgi:hypothetical protein